MKVNDKKIQQNQAEIDLQKKEMKEREAKVNFIKKKMQESDYLYNVIKYIEESKKEVQAKNAKKVNVSCHFLNEKAK